MPEKFTHGTSAQRVQWFKQGLANSRSPAVRANSAAKLNRASGERSSCEMSCNRQAFFADESRQFDRRRRYAARSTQQRSATQVRI